MSIWSTIVSFSDQPGIGEEGLGAPYETDYSLDTTRGGYFGVAHARSWLNGLRFTVESPEAPIEGECVLDRAQVRALVNKLTQWLETEPA